MLDESGGIDLETERRNAMSHKKSALICLTALVAFVAVIALAGAVKIELMPYPPAAPIDEDASGQAILNYVKGADKTEVQVNCLGLEPQMEYTVYLDEGGWNAIGTFTTRKNGSGNFHAKLDGDHSGASQVAVNNSGGSTVLLGP